MLEVYVLKRLKRDNADLYRNIYACVYSLSRLAHFLQTQVTVSKLLASKFVSEE